MKPPYSPAVIANNFLELSASETRLLTPMQLLKLVYIAHGWYLAVTGKPLINEPVQAWKYGPVVPSLFHELKRYGAGPVIAPAQVPVASDAEYPELNFETEAPFLPKSDKESCELLRWVWRVYGHLSGLDLSRLTHKPDTPWSITVQKMRAGNNPRPDDWSGNPIIEDELIRRHYVEIWEKRNVPQA